MINYRVKQAEAKRRLKPKQVAAALEMTLNTYSLTVGGFRSNPKNIEKIAEFHDMKFKHVNPNYKGNNDHK